MVKSGVGGKGYGFSCTVVSTFTLSTYFSIKSFSSFAALTIANNSSSIFSGPSRFRQCVINEGSIGSSCWKYWIQQKYCQYGFLQKSGHYRFVSLVVGVFSNNAALLLIWDVVHGLPCFWENRSLCVSATVVSFGLIFLPIFCSFSNFSAIVKW